MSVGLDHPLVADYLARFDRASAALPESRRRELREELQAHLNDALNATGGDEASVRGVLDRLGDPVQIVADELDSAPEAAAYGTSPAASAVAEPPPTPVPTPWGWLEIGGVVMLGVGSLVLPGLGAFIGLIMVWISDRWTRREKTIATVLVLIPTMVLALLGASFFVVRTTSSSEPVVMPEQGVSRRVG